jgi:tetratricopeptide (TPR) repeat protein
MMVGLAKPSSLRRTEMKDQLIDLLQRARKEIHTFVAGLSEEERAAEGTLERWSAKDILNHAAAWTARLLDSLALASRGEPVPAYDNYLAENDAMFEQFRDRSWDDTMGALERTWDNLTSFVQAASEEDLLDTQRMSTQNGRPLWRVICGNAYEHTIMHLAYYLIEKGQAQRAVALQESSSQVLGRLCDETTWRGLVRYNRACIYALAGEKEKALADLQEGLRLQPQLLEWSRQDPDLAPLRADPAYQALYPLSPA